VLQTLIHYAEKSSIFLLTVALIVGATGCSVALPPIGSAEPRYITTWAELDDIRNNLVGTYYLKGNLTTDMPDWAKVAGPDAHNGTGWWPIGVEFGQFRGHFYGMGNQICGLVINSERNEVGLFGYVAWPGSIHDVSVVNVTVHGTEFVGALVGRNNGNVNNCSCSGSVTGNYCVGGLVGWNDAGARIEKSSLASTCNVTGQDYVGGLVGWNKGTVRESYCSGRVIGADGVGGLVGFNDRGIIAEYSRSTGSVEGTKYVGGLVGKNDGKVSCSYSTGNVTGGSSIGGLVGCNYGDTIDSCYSNSTVEGTSFVGGLVGEGMSSSKVANSHSCSRVGGNATYAGGLMGFNDAGAIVDCAFSTGGVTGRNNVGGLLGGSNVGASVSNSFWDKETSGTDVSSRGTGKTTAEMMNLATFRDTATEGLSAEWDIGEDTAADSEWCIVDGQTYPFLRWETRFFVPQGK
jgi:hypothetical protein